MSSFWPAFLWSQFLVTPPVPQESLAGKIIIVTGANAGLGFEVVRSLVKLQAKTVILAVRNAQKGAAAKADIQASLHCSPETLRVWDLDMASFDSVKRFATKVNDELDRLDAVVLNAGIQPTDYELVEGEESTFTVNVTSTFLLALLVLPALRKTHRNFATQTHLTIVGSDTHMWESFPERNAGPGNMLDTLNRKESRSMGMRYSASKLVQLLCVRAVADRISEDVPVVLTNTNPGLCHSNMVKKETWAAWLLMNIFARRAELGARAIVAGVTAGKEAHGHYMQDGHVMTPAKVVVDEKGPALQEAVWKELAVTLESISPGVTGVI